MKFVRLREEGQPADAGGAKMEKVFTKKLDKERKGRV
jgi:hypothetical protein